MKREKRSKQWELWYNSCGKKKKKRRNKKESNDELRSGWEGMVFKYVTWIVCWCWWWKSVARQWHGCAMRRRKKEKGKGRSERGNRQRKNEKESQGLKESQGFECGERREGRLHHRISLTHRQYTLSNRYFCTSRIHYGKSESGIYRSLLSSVTLTLTLAFLCWWSRCRQFQSSTI